jgi:hypothetical protein
MAIIFSYFLVFFQLLPVLNAYQSKLPVRNVFSTDFGRTRYNFSMKDKKRNNLIGGETGSKPSLLINTYRGLEQVGVALVTGFIITNLFPNPLRAGGLYPIVGSEDIMSPKKHGTSDEPVMTQLR